MDITKSYLNSKKHFMEVAMRIEGGYDDELEWIRQEKAESNVTLPVKPCIEKMRILSCTFKTFHLIGKR